PPAAPARPDVEQLGASEANDQKRGVPHPFREVLDEVEQGILGPMNVLEREHERLVLRHPLDPLARRPGDLLLAALALDGLEDAGGEADRIGDRLVLAGLGQLLDRDLQGVVVRDSRCSLDHFGQRPVGDTLAVWQSAADEDRRALEPLDKLSREPALADPWIAVDREQVGTAVPDGSLIGVLEELELGLPSPKRGRDPGSRPGAAATAPPPPRPHPLPPAP